MTKKKSNLKLLAGFLLAGSFSFSTAQAWYDHTALMPWIVDAIEKDFLRDPEHPYSRLLHPKPSLAEPYETLSRYRSLAELLLMNPKAELPSALARNSREILVQAANDPDFGMDQELPDSADPSDDRKYMGGTKGTTSQGFRHMVFSGWNWRHPISTFQIPLHFVGQAIDRFELLTNEAKSRLQTGDFAWGLRVLGWSLHYVQDLTQPFHTNQVPSFRMLDAKALLHWPPTQAWPNFKRESQRLLENYHWAYEGYVREMLLKKDQSPFQLCLIERSPTPLVASPRELIDDVIRQSRARSPEVGAAVVAFFGEELKAPAIRLSHKQGSVDFAKLVADPSRAEARKRLDQLTCENLKLAKAASLWTLKWAFFQKPDRK